MTHKFIILKYIFFFLLCLCTINSNAQTKLDSLLHVLSNHKKEDNKKINLLNDIAKEYQDKDISQGLQTADIAIALAEKLDDQTRLAQAYLMKSYNYYGQISYVRASEICQQALSIFERLQNKKGIADCLHQMGDISADLSDYKVAINYYNKAKNINEQLNNKKGIAANINSSGRVYSAMSNYSKALESYQAAAQLFQEEGEKRGLASALGNLGSIYISLSDFPTALTFLQKSLKIHEQLGYNRGYAIALSNTGLVYFNLGNFSTALEYHKRSLDIMRKVGVKDSANSLNLTARAYQALHQNNEAKKYYLEAIKIEERLGKSKGLPVSLNNLGFLYFNLAEYGNAWDYFKKGLRIAEQNRNKPAIALIHLSMGELVRDAPDSILNSIGINPAERYAKTFEYLNKGKLEAKEVGSLVNQRFAWEDLSIAYERQKEYSKALEAYKNYIVLRDSILNNEKEKKVSRLIMQYEFDKQADSIKLQEQLTDQKLKQQELLAKQQQQELALGKQQIALGNQQLALTNKEKDLQQLAFLKTQADLQNEQLQKNEKEKLLIIAAKEKKIQLADAKKTQYNNRVRLYALLCFLAVLSLIAVILWRNNSHKQKANALLTQQKQETDQQKEKAEHTLEELKSTQTQLIQREKMASLGELTAGIAHEIQNPLNFVNNFSEVNAELIEEMEEEISKGNMAEIKSIALSIKQNLEKINMHGKRADGIVKGMMQHSQSSTGKRELTDINALADEYLRLSYHGLRAKDNAFNVTMKTDFDAGIPKTNIVHQDIGRVFLNLFNNAFYSVTEKKKQSVNGYVPTVFLSTKLISLPKDGGTKWIEIRIKDNGMGIPKKTLEKIYQPFFTTKPTGQGTGLGLSLSYDIITKANGGSINAETQEGEFAEFVIHLPV